MIDRHIHVGSFLKTFGRNGDIRTQFLPGTIESVHKAGYLIVEKHGERIPFFIAQLDQENNTLRLEEASSPEKARLLHNCKVYLLEKDLSIDDRENSQAPPDTYLEGFLMKDQEGNEIGEIETIIIMPKQMLASLEYQGKQVLIPLHQELIVELNVSDKVVSVELPDGLLNL